MSPHIPVLSALYGSTHPFSDLPTCVIQRQRTCIPVSHSYPHLGYVAQYLSLTSSKNSKFKTSLVLWAFFWEWGLALCHFFFQPCSCRQISLIREPGSPLSKTFSFSESRRRRVYLSGTSPPPFRAASIASQRGGWLPTKG